MSTYFCLMKYPPPARQTHAAGIRRCLSASVYLMTTRAHHTGLVFAEVYLKGKVLTSRPFIELMP